MSDEKDTSGIEEIDCLQAINGLYAYLDGEIADTDELGRIEHHLKHCRTCYSRTELETAIAELIRKTAKSQAPEQLHTRMRKLLDML